MQKQFDELVIQITNELTNVNQRMHNTKTNIQWPKIQFVEVFCGPNSELTKQMQNMNIRSRRFGLAEGDLSTVEGRNKLFEIIVRQKPEHVWFSPVCGPWSPWSHLNEKKSLEQFDKINLQRSQNLYQLALGVVLLRHQFSKGKHLHWEQTRKSMMFRTPLLSELYALTHASNFDMCQVGELKDPVSQLLIQKSMTVRTTSAKLHEQLHGRCCNKQHSHQQLSGTTQVNGQVINRTSMSEAYTRKFARTISKVLAKTNNEKPKGFHQWHAVFAAYGRKRGPDTSPVQRPKKFLKPAAKLIEPNELPRKRRRLEVKGPEEDAKTLVQQIVSSIKQQLPRVGKHEITDPKIIEKVQEVFNDKIVHRIVACKGTERTLGPPKQLLRGEAPYRRAIVEVRDSHQILVEGHWELWEDLSQRQLIRASHSCHVNITVFAASPTAIEPADGDQDLPPDRSDSQSTTPDESVPMQSQVTDSGSQSPEPEAPVEPKILDVDHDPDAADIQSQMHGNRFLALPPEERSLLIRVHKNLGHPSKQVLSQVLRQKGFPMTMIQALEDYQCSTCQMQQKPRIPRPATLKPEMDFCDKVSTDGVTWINKNGQSFHFYHYIDHGTNFQTACVAPSRTAEQAVEKLIQSWFLWAGPPNEMIMDSATEFTSEIFQKFLQQNNVKATVIPPGAHWQIGKTERHGEILQEMLSKFELDHGINNYSELQTALSMCTAAKNACSLRHGFSPEVLVFGKGLRVPGSVASDDHLPSHLAAMDENGHGIRFRTQLAMREAARKAFHEADNSMALRRAMLRRNRPNRGNYVAGEWVMIWRQSEHQKGWIGPCNVIQQDGQNSVFSMHHGTLVRAAPEHVRPVSSVEAQLIPDHESLILPQMQARESNMRANLESPQRINADNSSDNVIPSSNASRERSDGNHQESSNSSQSQEQPDTEPETVPQAEMPTPENPPEAHEVPVPDSDDDGLMCDLLLCQDLDDSQHLKTTSDLAWRFEVDVPADDVCFNISHDQVEELIFLASNPKKQRTEVKLSTLSPSEKAEFEKAKQTEVDNWLKTGTVCKILRNKLSAEQILRCRWIYVWKPIEDKDEQKRIGKDKKAKARLVVLGFLDPALDKVQRDSPTLGRQSRMLILQLIASMNWELSSFDIKAAFLQGKTQEGRVLAIEPVPEMAKAMQLKPTEVCKLAKSAYGLIDAPFLWYQELDRTLRSLSFIPSPFDPTVYVLYEPETTKIAGIIGVHVDDGLCGGNAYFKTKLAELEKIFPFGSKKVQTFTFTGIDMHQNSNFSINLSQEKYISKIEPIHIDASRKYQHDLSVTPEEQQALRALIGSLQYAAVNTRPDLSSRLSFLQSAVNSATIQTLNEANKILHDAKRHKDTTITVQPIPINKLRFLAFSDASFSSKKQPDSHTGMMIMTTHEQIAENVQSPVSPISWGCKKIQKVVVSTLSAEATSLNSTLDQLSWLRLYWAWILNPQTTWKEPKAALSQLPNSITTATMKISESDIAVTDCKSLFDMVSRTAPPNCQEFRTQLLARAIKDLMSEGVMLKWVHSGAQLADSLTKIMETSFLRETLKYGFYQLHDQDQILKDRANARNRLK